jgi:hypothetical protein
VVFSDQGLLKVEAIGKYISTDSDGFDVQNDFASVLIGTSARYGKPDKVFDDCQSLFRRQSFAGQRVDSPRRAKYTVR